MILLEADSQGITLPVHTPIHQADQPSPIWRSSSRVTSSRPRLRHFQSRNGPEQRSEGFVYNDDEGDDCHILGLYRSQDDLNKVTGVRTVELHVHL